MSNFFYIWLSFCLICIEVEKNMMWGVNWQFHMELFFIVCDASWIDVFHLCLFLSLFWCLLFTDYDMHCMSNVSGVQVSDLWGWFRWLSGDGSPRWLFILWSGRSSHAWQTAVVWYPHIAG